MRIFITGSASHLAQALLPKLCAHAGIASVIGIDLQAARFAHPKFAHHIVDIRGDAVSTLMRGCDALVHLAFVVLRGKMDARTMHDINVQGSRQIFASARAAGMQKLLHLSSAAVYGSGEHLTESAPPRPLARFLYAQHKAEAETWMARDFPEAVRLRPHIILGPHCQPLLKQLLRQPCYIRLPEPQPRLQCVHEDDVAEAIVAGLMLPVHGPFNLAASGSYSFKEAISERHRRPLPLPFGLARLALKLARRATGFGGEAAWLDGIRHTLTLDSSRAHRELRWQPRFDVRATLASVK